jgi:SAM-dependent methyltransferase
VTIVADLAAGDAVPTAAFDCFILTQTMQFIYELEAAMRTVARSLRPDGVLLATFPVISQICRYDMDRWGDYWRFTTASVQRLMAGAFAEQQVEVRSYGNVLAAISFLQGLAAEELTPAELDVHDPDYQVLIAARGVKAG